MKRLLTLSTFLLLSIMTFASTLVNGIYYEFSGTEATVVGTNIYTGSITIPTSVGTYSVTSIGSQAFWGCSSLTSVTIPNSVTSIGNFAFRDCSGLTSVTIPNSVTSIGNEAFKSCSKLTSITIPNSVTSIGNDAFSYCHGLTSIKVQEGNTKYDSRNNCNAIIETATNTLVTGCKNTTIPNSVIRIENYAFRGCSGLTAITIPENVMSIGALAFTGCSKLASVVIPDEVFSIGKQLFYNCSNLTDVTIGNGVTGIGSDTFYGCTNLKSVTLGKSIESVDASAFTGCSGITSIRSYIENPTAATGVSFDISNYSNATLYVPYGTKDKYLATNGWKNFANIVEMDAPSAINGVNAEDAKSFVGKFIKDNKIIIMKNGKKHSVSGQGM